MNDPESLRYIPIVGSVSPFVGSAVHQPGGIQDEGPTEQCCYEPCVGPGFVPEVDRGYGGQQEAQHGHQDHVVSGKCKVGMAR